MTVSTLVNVLLNAKIIHVEINVRDLIALCAALFLIQIVLLNTIVRFIIVQVAFVRYLHVRHLIAKIWVYANKSVRIFLVESTVLKKLAQTVLHIHYAIKLQIAP